ncbi:tripartite tricarboxylate transporter TctB family protein [Methylobrevis pamukkalensis]|uniref:Tripartite tricarboxylate transporter TctB family protein n=1 Tax=Methylobrevis pamukkalensis TaxID=1439726 RepID=A0A1E3GWG3_9HYPH|nr:tripartite tricarboxylate transporter TctB family protein [Methylobrevis pamukkalensis]ODN68393.1 Tripartite tricarboxylate transporter TctB family protein [Methylobrevis pamukkalensis]
MAHETEDRSEYTVSHKSVELVVAGILIFVSAVVMYDSNRIGAGWAFDGPESGYFPFYIGVILFISSVGTFISTLRARDVGNETFVERTGLKQIFQVLIPTMIFVAMIGYTGIYVASAIFIAFFMVYLGKYPVQKVAPVAIAIPVFLFVMFEIWFLVPLPKGPLESMIGY